MLPLRRVISRTSGEEFHSLKATAVRCERCHWLNKESCVDLPEPSISSTTISLPRWRFGTSKGIRCGNSLLWPDTVRLICATGARRGHALHGLRQLACVPPGKAEQRE